MGSDRGGVVILIYLVEGLGCEGVVEDEGVEVGEEEGAVFTEVKFGHNADIGETDRFEDIGLVRFVI